MTISRCAALELDNASTQTPLSREEGWRFYIDTPTRRYDLRSLDGEYKMWYWIEGIRNAQAKASQRLLSRELEESKLRRSREVNEYVFEDLQMHLSTLKERLNQEETEKKNLLSELKRVKYLHKKELQGKEKELIGLRGTTPSSSNTISASTEDDTKELFELLQASEKQVSDLRQKLTDQERDSKTTLAELQKIRDQQDLHRRRLENEVADLRQKLELETTTKNALQMNNRELDKELQQMHRLMQSRAAGPPWVPDWYVEACSGCKAAFTLVRRRHHCRQCGNIFCSKCSGMTAIIPSAFYPNARVRVCNGCYAAILTRIASNTPPPNSFPYLEKPTPTV